MKIENRANETIICGMDMIRPGQIFEWDNNVYLKILDIFIPPDKRILGSDGMTYNCINIETGEMKYIHNTSGNKVYPCYQATLILR